MTRHVTARGFESEGVRLLAPSLRRAIRPQPFVIHGGTAPLTDFSCRRCRHRAQCARHHTHSSKHTARCANDQRRRSDMRTTRVVALTGALTGLIAVVTFAQKPAVPKTPWGDPDLQGTYSSEAELSVPFERQAQYGDRRFLTDAEYAQRRAQANTQLASDNAEFDLETADRSNAGAVGSATSPPPHWLERGNPSRRTSLVIDPPDGRVPAITANARARIQRQVRGSFGNGPFNGPKDFTLY